MHCRIVAGVKTQVYLRTCQKARWENLLTGVLGGGRFLEIKVAVKSRGMGRAEVQSPALRQGYWGHGSEGVTAMVTASLLMGWAGEPRPYTHIPDDAQSPSLCSRLCWNHTISSWKLTDGSFEIFTCPALPWAPGIICSATSPLPSTSAPSWWFISRK